MTATESARRPYDRDSRTGGAVVRTFRGSP
jgi:hypothetical protein